MTKLARLRAEIANLLPVATHALAAVLPTLIFAQNPTWTMLLAAVVVGNLPDIDTAYSHIGRLVYPLARWLESRFGHRTITHSLLALALVTAVGVVIPAPWAWWWWAVWFGSHLLVDMVIGGKSGVPLFWPSRTRFYLVEVETGGSGERIFAVGLALAVAIAGYGVQIQPARILHERAGTLEFAIQDYRQWEATNRVFAEIEGTWQETHQPITGTFEIVSAYIDSLTLTDGNQIFTAGERDEDVYIRRIVARKGPPRPWAPISADDPTPTPPIVKIKIENVYNPDEEIKVTAGDVITRGQILADLVTYRARLLAPSPTATPAPTPTATPTPKPTPTPDPFTAAKLLADYQLIIAQATAAAEISDEEKRIAEKQLEKAARELRKAQENYNAVADRADIGALPQSAALQRATDAYEIAAAQATIAARPQTEAEANVWKARIRQAELAYKIALTRLTPTPTPPTPAPTPTPIPTPTPTIDYQAIEEKTKIRSLVVGTVSGWRIVEVAQNVAKVEIYVSLSTPAPATPETQPAGDEQNSAALRVRVFGVAKVTKVTDGDTIDVLLNGRKEKVRLIGVDTPETKDPRRGVQCFGPEAARFTTKMLLGRTVSLEVDKEIRDKYDRLLAYVWLGEMNFNAELVARGYARAKDYPPNVKYSQEFHKLERQARAAGAGLWGACQN